MPNLHRDAVNARFNEELQMQIDGILPKGHVYKLGTPGKILRAAGADDLPIELTAERLAAKAHTDYIHPFDLADVRNLPRALNDPVAVFAYGDKTKAINVIVDMKKDGKNFLAGISLNPVAGRKKLNIHSVRTIFPKDTPEWANWILQGKALYINKEKAPQALSNPRDPGDVVEDAALAAKIDAFQNPPV